MSALDRPPSLGEGATLLGIAAALVIAGYTAGVWHSANFASRTALERLEQRVNKLEQGRQ